MAKYHIFTEETGVRILNALVRIAEAVEKINSGSESGGDTQPVTYNSENQEINNPNATYDSENQEIDNPNATYDPETQTIND